MPREAERGMALVSVLWGIALLALIAAAMQASGIQSLYLGRNDWQRARAQTAADAATARAVLGLLDTRADRAWRADGAARSLVVGDAVVIIRTQDEAGKIDLNAAPQSLLQNLFIAAGLETEKAASLAQHIRDWRTLPENPSQASADGLRHGPFQSLDELLLVPGMTGAIFTRVAPALTIYSHKPDIDRAVAPRLALLAAQDDPQAVADILRARDAAATPTLRPHVGHAFAIESEVRLGPERLRHTAIVLLTGKPDHPFGYLAYR